DIDDAYDLRDHLHNHHEDDEGASCDDLDDAKDLWDHLDDLGARATAAGVSGPAAGISRAMGKLGGEIDYDEDEWGPCRHRHHGVAVMDWTGVYIGGNLGGGVAWPKYIENGVPGSAFPATGFTVGAEFQALWELQNPGAQTKLAPQKK